MPASSGRRFPAPLFRHFPPFSSNLISKTISTSLTWLTAEAHRPALSVGLHAFIPTLVKDVLKVSPPQTELKLLGAATGARAELPLQPPKHRHSITACPLHVHRWFCTGFISFESVLAQRGWQKSSPGRLGVSKVHGQPLGQLRVAPSVRLLCGSKLEVKWGNVPWPETVHLSSPCYCEPSLFCCTLGPNSMTGIDFLVLQRPCVGTRGIIFLLNTTLRALAHRLSSVHYNKVIPTFPSSLWLHYSGSLWDTTISSRLFHGWWVSHLTQSPFSLCVYCGYEPTHRAARFLPSAQQYLSDSAKGTSMRQSEECTWLSRNYFH